MENMEIGGSKELTKKSGHVHIMPEHKWSKIILEGKPPRKRRRG